MFFAWIPSALGFKKREFSLQKKKEKEKVICSSSLNNSLRS
jgi:hypothetical protein